MNQEKEQSGKLIVYGHNYCGSARLLHEMLDEEHIPYEWRDVMRGDPAYQDQLKKLARGCLSVPTVIFPDGAVMVEPRPQQVLDRMKDPERGYPEQLRTQASR